MWAEHNNISILRIVYHRIHAWSRRRRRRMITRIIRPLAALHRWLGHLFLQQICLRIESDRADGRLWCECVSAEWCQWDTQLTGWNRTLEKILLHAIIFPIAFRAVREKIVASCRRKWRQIGFTHFFARFVFYSTTENSSLRFFSIYLL